MTLPLPLYYPHRAQVLTFVPLTSLTPPISPPPPTPPRRPPPPHPILGLEEHPLAFAAITAGAVVVSTGAFASGAAYARASGPSARAAAKEGAAAARAMARVVVTLDEIEEILWRTCPVSPLSYRFVCSCHGGVCGGNLICTPPSCLGGRVQSSMVC